MKKPFKIQNLSKFAFSNTNLASMQTDLQSLLDRRIEEGDEGAQVSLGGVARKVHAHDHVPERVRLKQI